MINYNSFNGIDFICDSQGCYSVNTALTTLPSESTNSICLPSDYICSAPDYITTALALTSPEEYENLLNQAFSIFQKFLMVSVPLIKVYLDGSKTMGEVSKFVKKYFPNLHPQSILLEKAQSILPHFQSILPPESTDESLKEEKITSLVVGKDIANVTVASLKLINPLYPINKIKLLLQLYKFGTSTQKSIDSYKKGNKKIALSENLVKAGEAAIKLLGSIPGSKEFIPGKFVEESLSVTSSSLGYYKDVVSEEKKGINFVLSGVLLLSGLLNYKDLIIEQLYPSEEAA